MLLQFLPVLLLKAPLISFSFVSIGEDPPPKMNQLAQITKLQHSS